MLRKNLVASDLVVEANRVRLAQLFPNLLDNALAAASDPVLIEFCCEPARLGPSAGLSIRVRDNGPGLTPDQRRRTFEPFYTAKPPGTGLGTAIAHRPVEGLTAEPSPFATALLQERRSWSPCRAAPPVSRAHCMVFGS